MLIPKHLQIETIGGVCTAECTMCGYKKTWARQPLVMKNSVYTHILEKFKPYRDQLQYLTLHGLGEPLLDKHLPQKIEIAKKMGFKSIGFATNCTELSEQKSYDLINAGLDTLICSIDGITQQTHESIRRKTNFNEIVSNVKNFLKIRKLISGGGKIIIRFIRQELNKDEWPAFLEFWSLHLDKSCGDQVVRFDIHNWSREPDNDYHTVDINRGLQNYICTDLFERLLVYANGEVGLCCADENGFFKLGNVIDSDPIEIYNNAIFTYYRTMMQEGKIFDLEHCRTCTVPRSRSLKE